MASGKEVRSKTVSKGEVALVGTGDAVDSLFKARRTD